jgi:DNA (cytosine-5)-methyltransferase 1
VAYPINTQLGLRGADTSNSSREGVGVGNAGDPAYTLQAGHSHAVAYDHPGRYNNIHGGTGEHRHVMPTLESTNPKQIIAFSSNMSVPDHQTDGTTPTLKLGGHGGGNPPAVAYTIHGTDGTTSVATETETASCLRARPPGAIENSTTTVAVSSTTCSITPFDTTQISSPHNYSNPQSGDPCHPLAAGAHPPAVAFGLATPVTPKWWEELSPTLTQPSPTGGGQPAAVALTSAVRRLTPVECERLQGFPDNFTAIPWRKKGSEDCPDGPRYKALGNSMAVPVMRWIGERIAAVEAFNAP